MATYIRQYNGEKKRRKLSFTATSLQILLTKLLQKCLLSGPLPNKAFCCNRTILLVTMATKYSCCLSILVAMATLSFYRLIMEKTGNWQLLLYFIADILTKVY